MSDHTGTADGFDVAIALLKAETAARYELVAANQARRAAFEAKWAATFEPEKDGTCEPVAVSSPADMSNLDAKSMTDHAGFICFEQTTHNIVGTGDKAAAAFEAACETTRHVCTYESDVDFDEVVADLKVVPATTNVIAEAWVAWGSRWEVVDGIARTYVEVHGFEHPDDTSLREMIQEPLDLDALMEFYRDD